MNNLLLLGLIAGGLYVMSNKKTSTTPSKKKDNGNSQPPTPIFVYDCTSLKINDKDKFRKDFVDKIEKIKVELNINKDSLFTLDPVIFANKFIEKYNKSCANRDPKMMKDIERILFYGLAAEGIQRLESVLAIKDFDPNNFEENGKYLDLKGSNCKEPGLVGCEYVIDVASPEYKKWQETSQIYYNYLKGYLDLINQDAKIKQIWDKIKEQGYYP